MGKGISPSDVRKFLSCHTLLLRIQPHSTRLVNDKPLGVFGGPCIQAEALLRVELFVCLDYQSEVYFNFWY